MIGELDSQHKIDNNGGKYRTQLDQPYTCSGKNKVQDKVSKFY